MRINTCTSACTNIDDVISDVYDVISACTNVDDSPLDVCR